MKVIVIAGTTESRQVIEQLKEQGHEVLASTATALGSEKLQSYGISIHEGRLDRQGFFSFFQRELPELVIDASHPFAEEVTQNVKVICEELGIAYQRIIRPKENYDYDKIIRVENTEKAIEQLNQIEGNILLTTGTKTLLSYVNGVTNGTKRIFARVLDQGESRKICEEIPLQKEQIIFQNPPFTMEDTKKLIEKNQCKVLVTKDSGKAGKVAEKIQAAKQCGIKVILIERPKHSADFEGKNQSECEKRQNRLGIMVAGTGSGCGKTTITCALLQVFCKRKITVTPFKCGPDYIDPMLHKAITGRTSYNLDPFFMETKDLKKIFSTYTREGDFAIVEGVMGFYDGIGLTSEASSYEISEKLELPVILTVSVKGMAATVSACILGMTTYRKNRIAGIILNQCSKVMYEQFQKVILQETGIPVVGYLPPKTEIQFPSRHLGLLTAEEMQDLQEKIETLGELAESCFDLEQIVELAKNKQREKNTFLGRNREEDRKVKTFENKIRIAVTHDPAFCFCYEDNLNYLKEQGAELVFFSPLRENSLPENIQAIYLVGGYPELYAETLSKNREMIEDIKKAAEEGMPIIAECGGYLYLCDSLIVENKSYAMAGIIPQKIEMTNQLNMHFGYVNLKALSDGLLAEKGDILKGHEFHYSREEQSFEGFQMEKPNSERNWKGVYHTETIYAGYPHFYFRSNEKAIERFLVKAKHYRNVHMVHFNLVHE